MVRIDRFRVRLYSWVKLLLAAVVTMGVATTAAAVATAAPASATATPVIASTNANYSLTGTPMPKAFTGTTPANQADASLSAAVANPSAATTLSFTSVAQTYVFSPVGQVDVYSACSVTGSGSQLPSYIFAYTANPFTVSGTSLASGGTGVTGVSLVYTNPACSPTTAIPSGSEVYQTGAPAATYALANVSGGAANVNTASLTVTSQPDIHNGYASVDTTTGQVFMQPQPTATGNFTMTYAYCAPGITLASDPSGLSDGNCSTATVTYVNAVHCELVGELVTVSISSSTIYQAICSSTLAPATVTPGQTFTYDTIPGSSVIPVEENTSIGNATIQYGDNFTSIVPLPNGVSYVPGSAKAVGGDPTTRGQATVKYCTAPATGCDATLSGNYHTTYPYIELQLPAAIHIPGGSMVTLPYVEAQFKATGAPGTQIGTALSEFKLNTQVNIPLIGSNTAAFDGYPTSCGSPPQNSSTAGCPTSGTPAYVAPTIYPFTQIVPGVTAISSAGGSSGSDTGGSVVHLTGSGFTGASSVLFGTTPAASFTVNSDTSITAVTPAAADGTVHITVTTNATTSATSSADQFTFIPPSVPDAPSGIQVTPGDGTPADGAATISWSPSYGEGADVTGYTVTVSDTTTPSNPDQTCTSTDPTDSCSVAGLTNGDSYTASVVATNTNGNSSPGAVTFTEGAPTAPTGVSASAGQESATVSFSAPASSGDGSAVSGYTVTATDTTTGANGGQTASGSASPITVSGLTDADAYTFTVTATNASGTSQASSASSAVTPLGVPGAPTGVSGTSNANTQSVVSFTAPAATHGSAILSYRVTATDTTNGANGGQTCTYTIPTPAPDTTTYSCTVTGLTNGDSYTFSATATNAIGTGPASAASPPAVPSTTPGAPTGVTAVSNPDGTVQVSWVAPVSNGGSAITSYTATSSSGSKTCTTANGTTLTCAVAGTTVGTSYTYTVKATNANGASAASAASASVKTTSLPAAPTAVSGSGQPEQVTVSFTGDTTTAQTGGLTITGYTVTATDLTNPLHGGQVVTGAASPIVVTGLTDLDNYTFTVHATNSMGNSPESAASAQVAPGGPPTAPLAVTASNVSPGGNAQVSWSPPASLGGTLSNYTVTSSTGSKTCTYTGPFGAGETDTCTVTGLTIGTSYTYTVTATNQSGTGPASAASNAVVSSTTPNAPTAPSAATGNGQATVSFTGDTTTATQGGIAITGYTVTATDATTPANGGQTATALTSPITVTGLTNGDSYTFTVHATNANGNSAESAATAAVAVGRPSAPTAVVSGADGSSPTTLDVSWAAATSPDGTSPITGYTVTSSPGALTCTTSGTTCNVTGLTAKTAYTFTVTATNQFGTSPASAASTAQTAGFPGIPTGATVAQVTPIGANSSTASIVVTWTVPNNGGAALTTETATSSSGSKTCTDTTHLTAGQTATCTMTGLTTGTSYTVSVKGTNANGTGSASAASAAIIPVTLPAAPTALVAATGNGQATVSFTGDTTASTTGGSAIISYTVTSSPGGLTCTTATTSCTVTGLTNGVSYTFTATATTAVGTSVASAASAATNAGVPTAPTGVVSGADASSQTTLDVSWTAATSPDGTSPITGYTVTSTPGSLTCTTAGATTCNVTGLTAKTAYTFTVRATNQYGTGAASAASTSQSAGFPGIPTGVSAVLVQNVANGAAAAQVTVTWTVPNNGGAALTSQTATSSTGSKTCTDNTHTTAGQTASCTVTGLTDGTSYTFTVRDVNANGTGTASAASNAVVAETLPLAPTAVAGTTGIGSVRVTFTAPSTTNSGAISSYTVTATDTTNAGNGGQTASGSASPITVTGLTVGDTYTFTVRATGIDGTGPASAASAGVIPSNVPDAPTAVSATAGDHLAVVSWTAPFAEYSPITGYTVSDGLGDTCTSATTTCTVTGLTNGTPYTFTVTATNANGTGAASAASAAVTPLHTAITSAASTTFVNGSAGTFTVTADGTPTITYSETGALPNGVTFDGSTGILSGTPSLTPDVYGDYPLSVSASSALSGTDTQSFTLTVDAAPAITSGTAATFTVGSAGSTTVTATGYPQPTFSESGALPSGVTLDAVSGQLSGTPAVGTGGTYPITERATNGVAPDATQSFTLTVDEAPTVTSAASTTFTVGSAGTFTATASGFPTAMTFGETGSLPAGVSLNPATGVLSGTPAAGTGGTYPVTLSADNGVTPVATQSFTLTVHQAPAITSAAATTFTVGTAGSFSVTASGFPAPTYAETGALPSGVTLNPTTGALSGTPAAATGGVYALTVSASNGVGATASHAFTLTVDQAPAITSAASATVTQGIDQSVTLHATGFPAPTFSETGALPSGFTLSSAGVLSGNTFQVGAFTVTVRASNGIGATATQSFTLTVLGAAPAFTSAASTAFTVGQAGSFTVVTTGSPTAALSTKSALPAGVTLTDNHDGTATLAGTPGAGTGKVYTLALYATSGSGKVKQVFTLTVFQAPVITTAVVAKSGKVGAAFSATIKAKGYPAPTFSASTLPPGVTLTNNGSGSATLAGFFLIGTQSFTITASNGHTPNATETFTLTGK